MEGMRSYRLAEEGARGVVGLSTGNGRNEISAGDVFRQPLFGTIQMELQLIEQRYLAIASCKDIRQELP